MLEMRKSLFVLLTAVIVAMGFSCCTDDTIGPSISDVKSAVIVDSGFVLTGKSVRNDHLRSRSTIQLLGDVNAGGYGRLSSDVVAQFMPTTSIDTVGLRGGADWIDSCFITMRVASGDFTGDSLAPMRMDIYELNQPLPSPIYTDFAPAGYYNAGDFMGSVTYSASESLLKQEALSNGSIANYYEINVPVSVDYARAIYNQYKSNPATFSTPSEFAKFFPGIYITNSYGQGRVMNFYDIEFVAYYRKYEKLTESSDTIYKGVRQSYMAVTPEVIYNNNINLDPAETIETMVDDGEAIVMGPAGYEVHATFPIQDIIDKFKNDTKDALGVLNFLTLELPVEKVVNQYNIAPPKYLLMVKESYREKFFDKDTLTNNKDAFYAVYDEDDKSYTFTGLRDYMLDIINNKNGIATESDSKFIIMPIDVTIFSNNTSTYYSYYGSTSEVVTKIAPSISKPCLARLKLDKSIITLVYSKQTFY